jgi:hypothetical protein
MWIIILFILITNDIVDAIILFLLQMKSLSWEVKLSLNVKE